MRTMIRVLSTIFFTTSLIFLGGCVSQPTEDNETRRTLITDISGGPNVEIVTVYDKTTGEMRVIINPDRQEEIGKMMLKATFGMIEAMMRRRSQARFLRSYELAGGRHA